ncbi:MAG: hypothetical protein AD742_03295 [Methylibium sp. NZG]|nr:MAG: hypothetical protein AD742_03295 [Methylibium sp. NZG]
MLLLVDGKRTEAQVRALSAQAGVPAICFDELVGLGLIAAPPQPAAPPVVARVHIGSPPPPADGNSDFGDDSELPASRTLPPESIFSDTALGSGASTSWPQTEPEDNPTGDDALERAREMLLRAVRIEAPVAGSLTIFRLRRARTRVELEQLIEEVAARIGKPPHSLVAEQTLRRVRNVLDGRDTSPAPL